MKNLTFSKITLFAFSIIFISANAQQNPNSKYDYRELFKPGFYQKNGTETRSASGQPGAKYWQNRAW